MRYRKLIFSGLLLVSLLIKTNVYAQQADNWTSDQLMQPAELAKTLGQGKEIPVIFSVGPGAYIPHSIHTGSAKEKEHLDQLKKELKKLPKDKKIVIYCGCCPFDRCPNVRPAIRVLKDYKFTNYFLLNLPKNIKTDWIDKGYPTIK